MGGEKQVASTSTNSFISYVKYQGLQFGTNITVRVTGHIYHVVRWISIRIAGAKLHGKSKWLSRTKVLNDVHTRS